MRHKVAGRKLGRDTGHRRAMYRNLVTDLLGYEKITTTEAKAKEVRGLAEKMISLGKEGGLNSRRQALTFIIPSLPRGMLSVLVAIPVSPN